MIESTTPKEVTQSFTVRKIQYKVIGLSLGESVTFYVDYLDENGMYISATDLLNTVTIDGEEYAAWGSDDTYIVNILFQKIGVEKIT
jgi:hypothetical protein